MQKTLVASFIASCTAQDAEPKGTVNGTAHARDCGITSFPGGDWTQSCREATIHDSQLQCQCADESGQWWDNDADLCTGCGSYSNFDGHLTCVGGLKGATLKATARDCGATEYPAGDWTQSCRDATIHDSQLQCQCADESGQWWDNDADLCTGCNTYSNFNGHLTCTSLKGTANGTAQDCGATQFPGGGWSQSCRDATIHDSQLQCQCADANGQWWDNDADLCTGCNTYENFDGHLTCAGDVAVATVV